MAMMGSGHKSRISEVRMFLRADSAEELVRLQLQTNVQLRGQASYTDFGLTPDGKFICWFLVDVDQYPEFIKQINGGIDGTTE